MAIIRDVGDVGDVGILEKGDIVIFTLNGVSMKYKVHELDSGLFLMICNGDSNDEIFCELEIDPLFTEEFCSYFYGYPAQIGMFPQTKLDDYEALTRIVIGIYDVIEAYNMGIKVML